MATIRSALTPGTNIRPIPPVLVFLAVGLLAAVGWAASPPTADSKAHPLPQAPPAAEKPLGEKPELPVFRRYEIPWEKGDALLTDVRDETFGYDEAAFYWLVAQVNKLPPDLLKPDKEFTAYRTLLALPSSYRGQPVTIRGAYMSVAPFRVPVLALQKDVPYLYECSIREYPLDEERPIATVVVIEDPMTYIKALDNVEVKGYFYKVRKYQGTKGIGLAPMLIARRIELEETPPSPLVPAVSASRSEKMLLGLMIGGVTLLAVAFFAIRQRSKGKPHAESIHPVHRFRLRREHRPAAPGDSGSGGESGGPKR
jgi:hypothetical protein